MMAIIRQNPSEGGLLGYDLFAYWARRCGLGACVGQPAALQQQETRQVTVWPSLILILGSPPEQNLHSRS
jgi:hypothetical protein